MSKGKPRTFTPVSFEDKSRPEKSRNVHVFGLFDAPLWRDWLAWLNLLVIVVRTDGAARVPASDIYSIVISDALGFVLFGVVPGLLRRYLRNRRAKGTA
jgi:hypothetical protein